MKTKLKLLALSAILSGICFSAHAQGSAFVYQGRLNAGTNPATGVFDVKFSVYDNSSGGSLVGGPLTNAPTPVTNGLFSVTLDFGAGVFNGNSRWLEIGARTNGFAGTFTTLAPRQTLTPTPYAIMAGNAGTLGGQSAAAYVSKSGDTMTGTLNLPANGLNVGGDQFAFSGGKVGIGTVNAGALFQIGANGLAWSGGGFTALQRICGANAAFANEGLLNVMSSDAFAIDKGGMISLSGAILGGVSIDFASISGRKENATSGNSAGYLQLGTRPNGGNMTEALRITSSGNVGIGTSTPQEKLDVNGTIRTKVLTITGGADVAEPFKMSSKEIPKGAIVIINDGQPGELKMSERAYDNRVAGIVSGANGINPGISLRQAGMIEDGENVALSGRVYALADATYGTIKPGDLLTTSDTPGHCMKVTDHAKGQGAIIGKAMSSLKNGKGMVLVLVSLQ